MSYNQNLPELQFSALFLQFIMDFHDCICEYREGSSTQSPIWIWFVKTEKTVTCQICKSNIATGNSSSTNLITHLKRHHGFLKKYNAFQEYEELSQLKQDRLLSLLLFLFEEENKVVAKSKLDKIVLNHVDFSKNRIVL